MEMNWLEQIVQDVAPRLPVPVAPVRHPIRPKRPEVTEPEGKVHSDSFQEKPAGSKDEAHFVFARPLSTVGAERLKLVMGQPQQGDTDLDVGSADVLA